MANLYSPPSIVSPTSSEQETREEWITRRARMIFSAYRRDDFADPDSFLIQVSMVLATYPDQVVSFVSDPLTGIQSRSKFPPVLAEIKELCDDRRAITERLRHYATLPPFQPSYAPAPRVHPANVKVPLTAPQHATMRALAEQLPELARVDANGELWVPLQWMERARSSLGAWKPFTREELEGIYATHDGRNGHANLPQPDPGAEPTP